MKTSALIKKLTEIHESVPFDADVITGEDWRPNHISRVYHNPPHTFIEFEGDDKDEFEDCGDLSVISELEIRAHQMMIVRDFIASSKQLSPDEFILEINTQIERMRAMASSLLKQ